MNKHDPISYPNAPSKSMKGFKIDFEVDFAPFQPNSKYNNAIPGIRTIQASHKNDPVVNNDVEIAGSYETKENGVAGEDYHLNTDNPKKVHSITTFTDEINSTVPQSTQNGTSPTK